MWIVVISAFFVVTILEMIRRIFWREILLNTDGKAVFISGCDSGIGHRLAVQFAAEGCKVFAGCLRPEDARNKFSNENIRVLPLDIRSDRSVKEAIANMKMLMEQENLKLWCLVNNAGVCVHGEFDWLTMDQCAQQVEVNLLGTIRLTKACLPLIRKNCGRIITVTSVNGFLAYPGIAVYSATKFALEAFCDALRIEMVPHGVKVIVVQPADMAKLTSIMSDHQQKAQTMWDAMDEEDRTFYNDYFKKYQEATLKNCGLTSPQRFEDSPLVCHARQAVLGKNPPSRFLSAPLGFRIVYKLLFILPDTFRDFIFLRILEYTLKAK